MPSPEILEDMLERIRKAEGPDAGIDNALENLLGSNRDAWEVGREPTVPQSITSPYTSSLDACLSLLGEVLPGHCWFVRAWPEVTVSLAKHIVGGQHGDAIVPVPGAYVIRKDQPCLAFLEAILLALLSQHSIKE